MTQITKEAIEAGLRITLSSVNMPAGECLHETDVREILEAALPFLSSPGKARPLTCQCGNSITDPCIVCGKPKTLVTAEWAQKMAAREGDLDPTTGVPSPGKDGGQEVEAVSVEGSPLLEWAVDQWKRQVGGRPLRNVHRRSLDDVWRQVIRWAGGDPDKLVGPPHDELLAMESKR